MRILFLIAGCENIEFKTITKEQLEAEIGELESYSWKTLDGKTLVVWYRPSELDPFSLSGHNWMDFMYALTVEEVKEL